MTREDRNNKLKHFITCLKCEVSGKCCDDNCSIQYEAGNLGEIIENLEAISKVLEQELSGDAISRQSMLKIQAKYAEHMGATKFWQMCDDIKALPPVTSQPKTGYWIPVSERLPKFAGIYRVTRYYPNNVMNPNYLVDACCFDGSNTWYDDNRINHDRAYADNVIAWQENPEPYKVEPKERSDKA